ncbi:hypothetical protein [Salipaludibacillus daqingensis]|uniref:hypothetical protein n=1 Tax=Salipaludibacillus daqingensis TaxID=3041001 RepID=UPI0024766373|nr:hypothetical protein [Salipaludibacillus daqingensis]
MGMPELPDYSPFIDLEREDVINLILVSIALEEMALAHIINTEAEKLSWVIKNEDTTIEDLLDTNRSVERMLRNVIKKEMLLQFKLEDTLDFIEEEITDEM